MGSKEEKKRNANKEEWYNAHCNKTEIVCSEEVSMRIALSCFRIQRYLLEMFVVGTLLECDDMKISGNQK